jgi:hypothetical protein
MKKSWHLNRRTFLKGSGLSLSLPFMEAMAIGNESKALDELPRRAVFTFFPNGASMPPKTHANYKDWYYFPEAKGTGYTLRENHKYLAPVQDHVSFISGLSNPQNRTLRPHVGPTGYLTTHGIDLKSRNTISIDQAIVNNLKLGDQTPVETLVCSTIGGTGNLGRTRTLSYNALGNPIPALNNLSDIYEKMYSAASPKALERIKNRQDLLDTMLVDAKDLSRKLGKEDKVRLDEYLAIIREVEKKIARDKLWAKIWMKKRGAAPKVDLDVDFKDVENYMQTLYDLIYISFKGDITRTATYQIAPEDASAVVNLSKYIGLPHDLHKLSHNSNKGENGYKDWGMWDQFLMKQMAYLVKRLESTQEGDGTLLDRTLILQGAATGKLHKNYDYPLILAGGKKIGHKGGQFVEFDEDKNALADLFLRMGQSMGANMETFGDSTGASMSELFI